MPPPKKHDARLGSNTNHCDKHSQSNKGYFETNIQDNIPNIKTFVILRRAPLVTVSSNSPSKSTIENKEIK
jgi:hypothetical protein